MSKCLSKVRKFVNQLLDGGHLIYEVGDALHTVAEEIDEELKEQGIEREGEDEEPSIKEYAREIINQINDLLQEFERKTGHILIPEIMTHSEIGKLSKRAEVYLARIELGEEQ